jgi:hypothetical protein
MRKKEEAPAQAPSDSGRKIAPRPFPACYSDLICARWDIRQEYLRLRASGLLADIIEALLYAEQDCDKLALCRLAEGLRQFMTVADEHDGQGAGADAGVWV